MNNKLNKKQIIEMAIWVILSSLIQGLALTSFSVPAKIYPSGVSGLSRIISDILLDYLNINLPYFYLFFIINLILAIIVFKKVGKLFTIFSLIQTSLVSLFAGTFKQIIFLDEVILIAIFGGVINGIGAGIALSHNASTGGADFVNIYLSDKFKKSTWSYNFIFNCLLITITGLLYGWQRACLSIIYQYMTTFMIKKLHKRYTHLTITVISKKSDEVIKEVLSNTRHGITVLDGKGAYLKENTKVLYTVVNSFQKQEVIDSILKADPKAFINVQETKEIVGNYYQKPLD